MSQAPVDLFTTFQLPVPPAFNYNITIYVAEGHNEQRLFLLTNLQKAGFQNVRSCRDGLAALRELKEKPADVVLVASDLPGVSGLDFLKELKEDPEMHRGGFVLLAKAGNKDEIMLAVETGIDEMLIKPFAPADFLPKVRQAFQSYNNAKNPERLYELAKDFLRKKEFDKSKSVYEALAASASNAARPLVGLARIAVGNNDNATALKHLEDAEKRNDKFVHLYAVRGEVYAKMGKIDEAIKAFEKAIELSPLNLARYHNICDLLITAEKFEACVRILNIAVSKGLDDAYIIERLGFCYFRLKDYPTALKNLEQAVKIDPLNTSYLNSLAICYRDAKDYEGAIRTYNTILKKEPDNSHVLFNKALLFVHKGDPKEAARILERVVKMDPIFDKAKDKLAEVQASVAKEKDAKKV